MAVTDRSLKGRLAGAACALLGASLATAGEFEGWEVDTALLYYQESGGRVMAVEPAVNVRRNFASGQSANVKLVLDALTGATPSGATASDVPQTFTRPSGEGTYVVQPGEIPLDDTFHDTRVALSGSWMTPLKRGSRLTLGLNGSNEFDFFSLGVSAMLDRDFNGGNTTLGLGLSGEFDNIHPVGGAPRPFGAMAAPGGAAPRMGSSETKTVLDVIAGLTQVIDRRTLVQVNYSLGISQGYMTDPYKLLSRVNAVTGSTVDYLYEGRPDSRLRHSLYGLARRHLGRDVLSGSYRFYFDDWGISAHTAELTYQWNFAPRRHLAPHLRFYRQSAADFFRTHLVSGEPLPSASSADYRLAAFDGLTVGLKYGWGEESRWFVRVEYYTQTGDSRSASAPGLLSAQDLYPDLKATIVQIQYSF